MRKNCLSVIYFLGNYKQLFCLEYLVFSNERVVFVQESMKKIFFECGKLFFFRGGIRNSKVVSSNKREKIFHLEGWGEDIDFLGKYKKFSMRICVIDCAR